MINNVSRRISAGLCKSGLIPSEDFELYAYGFFVILSRILFLIITILLGILFDIVWESVLFYTFFSLIRSYAGGIHAPKEWMCILFTSILFVFCIGTIKFLTLTNLNAFIYVLFLLSIMAILILSPLDTKEKPINAKEKKIYRKTTYLLLLAIIVFSVVMLISNKQSFFYSGMISTVLESVLLLFGKIVPIVKNNISANQVKKSKKSNSKNSCEK